MRNTGKGRRRSVKASRRYSKHDTKRMAREVEPAPVKTYFVCPICGGDHPRSEHRTGGND